MHYMHDEAHARAGAHAGPNDDLQVQLILAATVLHLEGVEKQASSAVSAGR